MFQKLDHELDTLGTHVLGTFKSQGVFKNPVIAGGYIRDQINKKPFKDIDIFIPKNNISDVVYTANHLPSDYKVVKSAQENFGHNHQYNMNFCVWDINYLENINIQLIMTGFPEKNFHENLLGSFDFGLCQVFSEGTDIFGTEEFVYDQKHESATLLNLKSLQDLPKAMKRFFRFQEKYKDLYFKCPNLEIKNAPKEKDLRSNKQSLMYGIASSMDEYTPGPNPLLTSLANQMAQQNAQFTPQPPAAIPAPQHNFNIGTFFLTYTLDDVLTEEDGNMMLNWNELDTMLTSDNLDVQAHAHHLIEQYEEL